ncbi:hydroxyacid dehydrogenase [Endozoicomonas sp. G2_2]|uniref:phosphonate dehydrogenase n=1 Tax=Endozoicomonas sp. G2_2 TaxID=2821092 RepID=UPI001AD9A5BB|nr:phosphonate dehydrogenase [Endozoicomonas sp. G2_2]MBO9471072.1 hydroxyacid dehydrogenase [Endozoicomonas sp. G2_2]
MNVRVNSKRPAVVLTQKAFAETRERLAEHARLILNDGRNAWSASRLKEEAYTAEAIMAFMTDRVDEDLLAGCPQLKVVGGALKGYDNIDIEACTQRGIWVTNVPDLLTVPTAELAIGLTIGLARHIVAGDAFVRSGAFTGWSPRFYGTGLANRTVGIIGFGAIGQAIAQRMAGFDVRLCYSEISDRSETREYPEHLPLHALLEASDIVVLAAPLTDTTLHLINRETVAMMRPHALLINPGRGSVVDEVAVREALLANRLGGYAADVFEMEDLSREPRPKAIDSALRRHPRTLFTPHLGSAVADVRRAIEMRAAENIIRVLMGGEPLDPVNRPLKHDIEC